MELSYSNKLWVSRAVESRLVEAFCQRFNLSPISARVLAGRGADLETAHDILSPTIRGLLPNPSDLKDMDKAVERLVHAFQERETVGLLGDYDVDGATSTALLYNFLTEVGYNVEFYIPDRVKEGYGPNVGALQDLQSRGCKVVLTLDCGTTSFEPLATAKEMGLDVIVIDHHVAETKLPEAIAVVNPNRLDEDSETSQKVKTCAAVGISFLVMVALNRALRDSGYYKTREEPDLLKFLDLVALGTVCDVMPLLGLNRAFVVQGLRVLAKRQNIGLTALCDSAGIDVLPAAYHLGFILGPRINAGGRVGDASLGARLLTCVNSTQAKEIAEALECYNIQRKDIEQSVLEDAAQQAERQIDSPALVLSSEGWHEGVIGIAAGRMKDQWNKPTCVITIEGDVAKGSARSISGFDMGTFVHRMCHKGLLIKGGGHAMAAGFSLLSESIPEFQMELNQAVSEAAGSNDLTPQIRLDGSLSLGAVTPVVAYELEKLAPYGVGYPSPKFIFEEVVVSYAKIVGQKHIRLSLKQMGSEVIQAIAFRAVGTPLGDALLHPDQKPVDLVGSLKLDQWGGNAKAQLVVEDVRDGSIEEEQKEAS